MYLILDIGSSSVRTLLFNGDVRLVPGSVARRAHRFTTHTPGESTADANALLALAEACLAETLAHPAAARLSAVGMTTFVSNVLELDARGNPITPIYTYADSRCADDVRALRQTLNADEVHQRTGCPLHTAYLPARLRWLRRTQAELYARCAEFVDLGTYLQRRWSGRADAGCGISVASWSGLLARATGDWDVPLVAALDLVGKLPPISVDALPLDALAARHPALRGVPCYPVLGDGAAANLGAGADAPGIAALTAGTTAALRVIEQGDSMQVWRAKPLHEHNILNTPSPYTERGSGGEVPPLDKALWSYRLDESHHLIGGATSEGGNIYDWLRATLQLPDQEALEQALADAAPDAHGLTLLPLLAGERSPGYAPDATGAISGLRLGTTPIDIAQAALESVALRLALIAERLGDLTQIMTSGGALERSPAWTQMFADALDRPLTLLSEGELTARGAALWVRAQRTGRDWSELPPTVRGIVHPRPQGVLALRAARERQMRLYEAVMSLNETRR